MNIFDLQATISLDASGFESGLQSASQSFQGFGQTIQSTALGNLAASAVKAAGKAVVGFGQDVVETGQSFESGMSQVAATLGMTMDDIRNDVNGAGKTFSALKSAAAEMGRETIYSAVEASEGLNILAMSGYSAEKAIEMLPTVLNLAAAGGMSMADAAAYVSGSMKGFADDTKTASFYADIMAKGATMANTSVSQLGEAMSSGAAGAAAYGQSAESMTIALMRLAEQGEVGGAAGTSLAAAMKNLYTPTDQAAQAMADLGIAAYDSSGKARDFNDIVNELNAALSGMTDAEANAYKQTIFGIQGLNAYNKMTVTGIAKQNDWAQALAGASDGIGEAAKQYSTMTDNLEGAKAGLDSALDGMKNAVYEKLRDPLKNAANTAASAINQITAGFESDGIRGALAGLGGFVKEKFTEIWSNIELPPALQTMGDVLKGAFDKAKSAVESTGIGVKIADAVDTIAWSFNNAKKLSGGFADAFGENGIPGVLSKFGSFVLDFWGGIRENMLPPDIYDVVVDFEIKIGDAFNGLKEKIGSLELGEKFKEAFGNVREFVGGIDFAGIFGGIKEKISGVLGDIDFAGAFGNIKEKLSGAFGGIKDALGNIDFAGAFGNIKEKLSGAFGGIKDALGNIDFAGAFGNIKEKLSGAFSGIKDALGNIDFSGIFGGVKEKITGAFGGIKEAFSGIDLSQVFGGIQDKLAGVFDKLKESVADKIEAIKPAFESVKGLFGNLKDAFSGIDTGFLSGIADSIGGLFEVFQNFGSLKLDGITTAVKGISDAFTENDVGSTIAGIAESFGKLLGTFASASVDVIGEIAVKIKDFLAGFKESSAFGSIAQLAKDIGELFRTIMDVSADVIDKVAGGIKRFLGAFDGFSVGKSFGDFVGKVGELLSAVAGISSDLIEDVGDAIGTLFDKIDLAGAGEGLSTVVEAISKFGGTVIGSAVTRIQEIREHFSGFFDDVAHIVGDFSINFDALGDAIGGFFDVVGEWIEKLTEFTAPLREFADQVLKAILLEGFRELMGLVKTITDGFTALVFILNDLLSAAIKAISGDFTGAADAIRSAWDGIGAFFEGVVMNISAAFSGIGDEIMRALGAVVDKAKEVGSNIINGLVEGITATWDKVKDTVVGVADKVVGFFTRAWDEHSPSRVFRRIGAYGMEGLRLGWMDEYAQFRRELERENVEISAMTKTSFENSAIGKSSAAGVSSLGLLADGGTAEPVEVNLILDGDVAASALYDPIQRVAFQRGTAASTHGREVVSYA